MDWRLSRFGDQPGAGTVFTYAKDSGPDCPGECITAEGPTDVAVNVVVCKLYSLVSTIYVISNLFGKIYCVIVDLLAIISQH